MAAMSLVRTTPPVHEFWFPWVSALGGEKRRPLLLKSTKIVTPHLGLEHPNSDGEYKSPQRSACQPTCETILTGYNGETIPTGSPEFVHQLVPGRGTVSKIGKTYESLGVTHKVSLAFKLCQTLGYLHLLVNSTTSIWGMLDISSNPKQIVLLDSEILFLLLKQCTPHGASHHDTVTLRGER